MILSIFFAYLLFSFFNIQPLKRGIAAVSLLSVLFYCNLLTRGVFHNNSYSSVVRYFTSGVNDTLQESDVSIYVASICVYL